MNHDRICLSVAWNTSIFSRVFLGDLKWSIGNLKISIVNYLYTFETRRFDVRRRESVTTEIPPLVSMWSILVLSLYQETLSGASGDSSALENNF